MKTRWIFLTIGAFLISLSQGCGNHVRSNAEADEQEPAPWELLEEGQSPPESKDPVSDNSAKDNGTVSELHYTTAPDSIVAANNNPRFPGVLPFEVVFNDSNKYQYAAGEKIGIKPIKSLGDAYFVRRPLVKVSTNDFYNIEYLTHSIPYLVPEAAKLLETIGRNFRDSLKRKDMGSYRVRVTSLLRSDQSVKSLLKVNGNATDSSTHKLGTTFDITYSSFVPDANTKFTNNQDLVMVLAEVLRDLRNQKKCMVKYEIKSPCFHITATGH